jgi:hypothetical protein
LCFEDRYTEFLVELALGNISTPSLPFDSRFPLTLTRIRPLGIQLLDPPRYADQRRPPIPSSERPTDVRVARLSFLGQRAPPPFQDHMSHSPGDVSPSHMFQEYVAHAFHHLHSVLQFSITFWFTTVQISHFIIRASAHLYNVCIYV